MEFGLFNSACVLPQFRGDEHRRIMDEVAIVQAAERVGFKYTWATEHHFLTEYSHLSANEVFLGYLAAATSNIHLGSGIFNITPPVNHPARIAERVAMLDHLSEGRFEFGMGRGSSTTEQRGFGIDDPNLTRDMFDEVVGEFRKMWRAEEYPGFDGKFFSMPQRNVLPKPYSKPHPPMWVAAGNPSTFEKAARMGLGVLCFTIGGSGVGEAAHRALQEGDRERRAGRRLRERQHHGDDPAALPRGRPAGARSRRQPRHGVPPQLAAPIPRHLPQAGRRAGVARAAARPDAGRDRRGDRGGRDAVRHARRGRASRFAGTPTRVSTRSCSGCCRRRWIATSRPRRSRRSASTCCRCSTRTRCTARPVSARPPPAADPARPLAGAADRRRPAGSPRSCARPRPRRR